MVVLPSPDFRRRLWDCKGDKDGKHLLFVDQHPPKPSQPRLLHVHLPSNTQGYTWIPTMTVWKT